MIEQINTIDYDDEEFEVNFYDTLYTYRAWTVNVHNLRSTGRNYWWRCAFTCDNAFTSDDGIRPDDATRVVQHFFAASYPTLKAQIIDFIARYFFN